MRRKTCLSTIVLITLAVLFSLAGLSARNAVCKLAAPEVNVIPSEAQVGQQVLVQAQINVETC